MRGGNFTMVYRDAYASARAEEIMNSKSSNESRWSVRINGDRWFATGIATKLRRRKDQLVIEYDENAIIFYPFHGSIRKGKIHREIHKDITKAKNGDEIHFRFQSKLKKFSISFVC